MNLNRIWSSGAIIVFQRSESLVELFVPGGKYCGHSLSASAEDQQWIRVPPCGRASKRGERNPNRCGEAIDGN